MQYCKTHIKILIATKAASDVVTLILKKNIAHIPYGPFTADKEDYLVLVNGRVIGRIFQQPQAHCEPNTPLLNGNTTCLSNV